MADPPLRFEGSRVAPPDARFAIVHSRFNELLVDQLLEGARRLFELHGVTAERVLEVAVGGVREMTPVLAKLAKSGKFDAIVTLGAVIRGATPHFDLVAGEVSRAAGSLSEQTQVPIIFGVLTTDTIEQAIERAGTKAGNKGADAAITAIEMANLMRSLSQKGY